MPAKYNPIHIMAVDDLRPTLQAFVDKVPNSIKADLQLVVCHHQRPYERKSFYPPGRPHKIEKISEPENGKICGSLFFVISIPSGYRR
jgi:hypothetical protein